MAIVELALAKAQSITWRHYYELTKPKVVALILFTALVGMLLSSGEIAWNTLLFGLVGIGLAAAAGAALNHVVDQRIDALMERTKGRPLPSGHMDTPHALGFALFLAGLSFILLTLLVNLLTALLTFGAFIGYAVIYTVYLKRNTPQNIVWGGLAGAMPPLLGWVAVTGEIHTHAWLLVLLIFVWTPPHFWSLAIKRRNEYAQAGIPMLPVTHGVVFTKQQILLYSLMLLVVSLMPFSVGMMGPLYLVGAGILGLGFVYRAIRLLVSTSEAEAMKTFGYSILYLSMMFALMLLDRYWPIVPT